MITKNILELSVDDLIGFFDKERPATVTFLKKDGTLRTLTGSSKVNKDINGKGAAYDAKAYGQVRIYDLEAEGWRTVTANRVKEVIADNVRYVVQ